MLSFCTYPIETFKGLHKSEWMETMKAAHEQYGRDFPNRDFHHEQLFAWDDCFDVLQRVLSDFPYPDFYLVFEYILHAENACRPDVILVSSDQVFVLEFKHKEYAPEADIAQADMYGRFMSTCHVASRDKEVITCLVLTKLAAEEERMDGSLHFVSERALKKLLQERIKPPSRPLDIDAWQKSLYEPDKNSLRIMVEMFEQNELPHLKTARSPKIPVASTFLKNLTATAKAKKEHWLCVISGVPGAGKTLLGVQYIYEMRKLDSTYQEDNATYVSGNAPLLKVLKGQLKYPSFLMTAPSLINSHRQGQLKATKLLVFDEAQRMWSKERMKSRNRGDFSENQQIIDILSEPDWGVLIALIGEGQEIYEGEDGGIEAWVKAVPPNWNVACSPKYQEAFAACKAKTVTIEPSLHFVFCPIFVSHGVLFNDLATYYSGAELDAMQFKYVAMFQAGWFVESMWSQTLVIHMIRTPKLPFIQSHASAPVMFLTLTLTGIAVLTVIPFTPIGPALGFVALPAIYFAYLIPCILLYMVLATSVKKAYVRHYGELL